MSILYTLGYVSRTAPEYAHVLAPYDGRITAILAQSLSGPDASVKDRMRADRLAREALRSDATAVEAVSTLGLDAQLRGSEAGARRLFSYAQWLSRRDLRTGLWSIEDAVGRGDIDGALRHYDIVLRTQPAAQDLLYPVLASAIADPAIRKALVRTLGARPAWSESLISYIPGNAADPRSATALFGDLRRAGIKVGDDPSAHAINVLIAKGFGDEAWQYYAQIRRGADRRFSRDPHFSAGPAVGSLFDWAPINEGGISVSIQRGDKGGIVDFSVPASVAGPLLQQVQILPPGKYRLVGRSRGIDQPDGERPYWVLSCRTDDRELGRIELPNSTRGTGAFAGGFVVPAGCPLQVLTLAVQSVDTVGGLQGQIDWAELSPVT